tara:strand:+ start:162 stop:584 length:423 start_codon:yes stop_codon:yes gene_type:complete
MTVIRPNSISGVTSITALQNSIEFYKSDGSLSGANIDGISINTAGVITATSFVGSGANLTGISGFATAMSSTPNTLLNECFKTTEAFTIPNGTQIDITNNETTSGKTVFTRLNKINVATGATFRVSAGTTFVMNVLGVFP